MKVGSFGFGDPALHSFSHIFDFLGRQRIVHQLQVVFVTDLVVDKEADFQGVGLRIIPFPANEVAHSLHHYLKSIRVYLSDRSADIA